MYIDPTTLHPRTDRGHVYLEAFGILSILLVFVLLHFYFTTGIGMPNWRALTPHSAQTDELAAGFTHLEKPMCEPVSGARGRTRRSKETMGDSSSTTTRSRAATASSPVVAAMMAQKMEAYAS